MMVEDDDKCGVIGIRSLVDWGKYNIEIIAEAYDGEEAYQKAIDYKPELIFTDIVMPGFSGLELLEKFHKNDYFPDVVILSGYAEFEYAQMACRLGAFDYLIKPLERDGLVEIVERIIEKHEIMNESNEYVLRKSDVIPTTENRTLNVILEFIDKNFSSNLKLYDISEQFHFNSSYISQLFKKELGISFPEYITRLRLNKAEKLLKETVLPVKEICCRVGIDDYFYFNKLFKRYKNITPGQIRL